MSKLTGVNSLTTLKLSISNTLSSRPGSLLPVLETLSKHGMNLTHMESQLHQYSFGDATFELDFEGWIEDAETKACIRDLKELPSVAKVTYVPPRVVPWFPTTLKELDDARTTLDGGTALISEDHPGFKDEAYKKRRDAIVRNAMGHSHGKPIPKVHYTEEEHETWRKVYDRLQNLHQQHACEDYLRAMHKFNRQGAMTRDRIPQLADVSELLHASTGFQIRPVAGLLTARDFLNSLAFRIFWSTQYIRHYSNPFYTPEPDVCHELLGHVPLFAHPEFAEFSQTIGLASLGATDEQIDHLATLYWFTVEFGLLETTAGYKAYGAGVLSSFGELEWACSPSPSEDCRKAGGLAAYEKFKDMKHPQRVLLRAGEASKTAFPITTYQPLYFTSPSLGDAKEEVVRYCDTLTRPFFCRYDPFSHRIKVTRSIERDSQTSTADLQATKQAAYFENMQLAAA
jgi:phenylalanine-4-hydroxylase